MAYDHLFDVSSYAELDRELAAAVEKAEVSAEFAEHYKKKYLRLLKLASQLFEKAKASS